MAELSVTASTGDYQVIVEAGLADRLADAIPELTGGAMTMVIADSNTAPLLGRRLAETLDGAIFEVPAGERSKTLAEAERACAAALEAGLDRRSAIVAVGGGVVGDLAGMVAAIYMRGVRLVHVPTSLLAMVDSSIGGKTGVNLAAGKNLVGAFKPPVAVFIDPALLHSLDEREFRSGLAEVAKYSMIADEQLYDSLLARRDEVLARDPQTLADVIASCCAIKAGVVSRDEFEGGERAILNYGHTFGHALEAATDYGRFTHGEAVSVGMAVAVGIGINIGVTPPDAGHRQGDLLDAFGLPDRAPGAATAERITDLIGHDKKTRDGDVRWVLLERLGHATPGHLVPAEIVRAAVRGTVSQG